MIYTGGFPCTYTCGLTYMLSNGAISACTCIIVKKIQYLKCTQSQIFVLLLIWLMTRLMFLFVMSVKDNDYRASG